MQRLSTVEKTAKHKTQMPRSQGDEIDERAGIMREFILALFL